MTNIPDGTVRVFATCDRITDESASHGDAAERGWVYRIGSREIYESRNDVPPLFEARYADGLLREMIDIGDSSFEDFDADESARDTLRDILRQLGSYETDDGSTVYGTDDDLAFDSGDAYQYAIHTHVKYHSHDRGWVEEGIDIRELANIK